MILRVSEAADSQIEAASGNAEGGLGLEQDGAPVEESVGKDDNPADLQPFLQMSPQQLLRFRKQNICARKWPRSCSDLDSNSTRATNGWLCNPTDGTICEMTIYKNEFDGKDQGPEAQGPEAQTWQASRARCISGTCQSTRDKFEGVRIKKISEIGAQICEEALKTPTQVVVAANGKNAKVDVKVIASKTNQPEDISVQLRVPLSMVQFQPAGPGKDGTILIDEKTTTLAVKSAFSQLGILETARAAKMCGHGFTNALQDWIDKDQSFYSNLMMGRAKKLAEVATAQAPNHQVITAEGVVHLIRVNAPCAGLFIKLNGAAEEECKDSDWEGEPLNANGLPAPVYAVPAAPV